MKSGVKYSKIYLKQILSNYPKHFHVSFMHLIVMLVLFMPVEFMFVFWLNIFVLLILLFFIFYACLAHILCIQHIHKTETLNDL